MADIDDPTATAFANEKLRVYANVVLYAYYHAKAATQEWIARGGAALIPNDPEAAVLDGADRDARPEIDGADCNNVVNRMLELVADLEANNNAKLNTLLALSKAGITGPPI